jgi:hypothetical protein
VDGDKSSDLNSRSFDGETIFLFIDGVQISKTTKVVDRYGAAESSALPNSSNKTIIYKARWFPPLFIGNHNAKIVIETSFGETVEYEWEFEITFR